MKLHGFSKYFTNRKIFAVLLLLCFFFMQGILFAAEPDWFEFTMPFSDTSTAVTHVGMLFNDAPAGRHGHLEAKDGRFYFADGTRARFWGVNVVSNGNFPNQADAALVAARLEKLGYNLVRIHSIDVPSPTGILDASAGDRQTISVSQLDKLDYFIYQLKQHGIYTNLNLHVSRVFTQADGVVDAALIPLQSKAVSLFDDRIITLQKDYAQKLFSHTNPYTGLSYADDPAIAMAEINNEDNLLREWEVGRLFGLENADRTLTPYYVNELNEKWIQWLSDKYTSNEALLAAWQPGSEAGGSNQAVNPGFEDPISTEWVSNVFTPASGQFSVDTVEKAGGICSMRATVVTCSTESWRVRLYQCGFVTEAGIRYRVRFKAAADTPHRAALILSQYSPSVNYGLSLPITIEGPWREYEYYFIASTNTSPNPADPNYARFAFNMAQSTGTLWLDDVEFSSAPIYALQPYESLEQMNVERTTWTECGRFSARRIRDNTEFYTLLEKGYFSDMINYMRSALGVKALITTTSQFFGEPNLLSRMDGDYMDQHAYWDHPQYLSEDKKIFKQNNNSLISATSYAADTIINRGALLSVNNKPLIMSEYNHCFPNQYEYEMLPILAAYGLFQDWDGLVLHSFSRDQIYDANYITNYFLSKHNSVKLAQMPMCALIFRRAYVQQARRQLSVDYSREDAIMNYASMVARRPAFMVSGTALPSQVLLQYGVRKNTDMPRSSLIDEVLSSAECNVLQTAPSITSDTGELLWNRQQAGGEYVTFNSPYFQGADGFIAGKTIELAKLTLAMETNSAVYVVSVDSVPIGFTGRMLLTLAARQENTGQVKDENNGLLELGSAPVLMEPVRGRVSLKVDHSPYECMVYALDECGQRKSAVAVDVVGKTISFTTGDDTTPWYEIVVPPDTGVPSNPKNFTVQ